MTMTAMDLREEARQLVHDKPAKQPGREFAYDEWKLRGACHGNPTVQLETAKNVFEDHILTTEDFYIDEKTYGHGMTIEKKRHLEMLKRTCGFCPVLMECRELAKVEDWGFLAGLSETERRRKRKGR